MMLQYRTAVDYLGVRMDDSVSVAEMFRDDTTKGFDVSIQAREVPTPQRGIVDEPGAPLAFQS